MSLAADQILVVDHAVLEHLGRALGVFPKHTLEHITGQNTSVVLQHRGHDAVRQLSHFQRLQLGGSNGFIHDGAGLERLDNVGNVTAFTNAAKQYTHLSISFHR